MRIPTGRYRIAGIRYWPEYWSAYSINDTCYLTIHHPITLMKKKPKKTKMIGANKRTQTPWPDETDAELAAAKKESKRLSKELADAEAARKKRKKGKK